MPKVFSILFGALWTAASAWACGRLLLCRLRLKLARGEDHLLAFVTGAALLSLILFVLAALHQVKDAQLIILGGLLLLAVAKTGYWRSQGEKFPPLPRTWRWIFGVLFATFALFYVAQAMSPEISPDGSTYHLGVVSRYYREHGMVRIAENMYAHLSQGMEMLFLMAYAFGRHSSAALVHCLLLLALPLLIVCFGRRFGVARAAAGGALFFFLSPVAGIDGASAYNDVAVACVLFAIFYLLEIWRGDGDVKWIVPVGILAGFAYALKYTAFLGAVYAALVIGAHYWRTKSRDWRPAAIFAAGVIVLAAPWMIRNAIWFGNPFSPLANLYFPNPYIHISFEHDYAQSMRHYAGLASYKSLPLELTVRGLILGGVLGPLFLLAPAALLSARTSLGRRVLFAGLFFSLPYAANIGTRFLVPGLPFLSIAMALAFASIPALLIALTIAHAAASLPYVVLKYTGPNIWAIKCLQWKPALRLTDEYQWLSEQTASFRHAKFVEMYTTDRAVIYAFSPYAEAYGSREVRLAFQSAANERLRETLLSAMIPDWQPVIARDFTFSPSKVRRLRVVQTAGGADDIWSVHEFRIFNGPEELPRLPEWRLRAQPNPWDVQLAFDNSPATRWKAWQRIEPGMFVDVDMGREEIISRVTLEGSADQHAAKLKLEIQDSRGEWKAVGGEPVRRDIAPQLEMRRMAIDELRRNGITHLFVTVDDFGYDDFEANSDLWTLVKVMDADYSRLYRLR